MFFKTGVLEVLQYSHKRHKSTLYSMGGGGGVVFAGGREMKIFSTVFHDFGENMVGQRYFQH